MQGYVSPRSSSDLRKKSPSLFGGNQGSVLNLHGRTDCQIWLMILSHIESREQHLRIKRCTSYMVVWISWSYSSPLFHQSSWIQSKHSWELLYLYQLKQKRMFFVGNIHHRGSSAVYVNCLFYDVTGGLGLIKLYNTILKVLTSSFKSLRNCNV